MSLWSRVAYPVRTALTARRHCWGGLSKRGARETALSDTTVGQVEMQGGSRQAGQHESWSGSRRNDSATSRTASLVGQLRSQGVGDLLEGHPHRDGICRGEHDLPGVSVTADSPRTRRVPASITSLIAPRVSRLTSARGT